jgi:hypothetical protein
MRACALGAQLEPSRLARVLQTKRRRLPVPTLLQYPLERERDVQRRWKHLLQRTARKEYSSDTRKVSAFTSPGQDGDAAVPEPRDYGLTSTN